ncbi:replication factor C subunit 1-like isoform X2 [Sycon ciliatum]|uniref:replication factor C subunit 1-like isoform X2 n=1 Tax=Sycon ciliatum TaxID=27933 RepID=UPI0031F60FB7
MDIRKWLSPAGGKQAKPAPKRKAAILSDDDDEAFTGSKKKAKVSPEKPAARSCKKEISRKRINYIDSSDSDDGKKAQPSPAKKKGSTSRYFDSSKSSDKATQSSKKDISADLFFGDAPVKQTPAKMPAKKSLSLSKKVPTEKTVIPETPEKDLPISVPDDDMEDPLDDPEFTEALLEASDAAFSPALLESPAPSVSKTATTPVRSSPRKNTARLEQSPLRQSPRKHERPHLKVPSSLASPKRETRLEQSPKRTPTRPSSVASPTKASTTVEPAAKTDVCTLRTPTSTVKAESPKPKSKTAGTKANTASSSSSAMATPTSTEPRAAKKSATTPSKAAKMEPPTSANADPEEASPAPLKRNRSYFEYKNREGPRNIGSRQLPEGAENCLAGLTFIITGVLEYCEREDAQELVTRNGGKLTQTVGKRTSYVVTGREPGPAKIEKANKLGIKQLTEEEFFDLVKELPAKPYDGAGASTPSKGKGASKNAIILGVAPEDEIPAVTVKKQTKPAGAAAKAAKKSDDIPLFTVKKPPASPSSSTSAAKPASSSSSFYSSSTKQQKATAKTSTDGGLSSKLAANGSSVKSAASSAESSGPESVLWVDKYRPRTLKQLIGQQGDRSNMNKLLKWLRNWHRNTSVRPDRDSGAGYRAALLSGPPGIGKTTTATLVCQEAGFHYVELNASDTRSKKSLQTVVAQSLDNQTINGMFQCAAQSSTDDQQRNALLMDEVDGMAGNEDRGGMQELVALIKSTKMPIICMCNDRQSQKIRSLANYCFDLRFQRPRVEQIRAAMLSVAYREGISIKPPALDLIINAANHDVRQVLHHMYLWTIKDRAVSYDQAKEDSSKAEKHMKMSPFEVVRRVFSPDTVKKPISDQLDLFFQDYSLMPLFVQEMYPKVRPRAANSQLKTLDCLANAAESISRSDLVERTIRSSNNWGLLQLQGMLSTVVPGTIMCGSLSAQVDFPAWLGKRSKQSKCQRLLQDISLHSRLTTTVSKVDMGLDMAPHLYNAILRPLASQGSSGVPESVDKMTAYSLLREDLDSLAELCTFPPKADMYSKLETKTKSAFTRHFNKTAPNTTFSVQSTVTKKRKTKAGAGLDDQPDGGGEDGENPVESDEEEVDVAAILQKKPKQSGASVLASSSKAKAGRGSGPSAGRGRGKGAKKR